MWRNRLTRHNAKAALIGTLAMLATASIARGDAVPAKLLQERCEAYQRKAANESAQLCETYLRGFLRGAAITGDQQGATQSSRETWSDRAARTRVGERALERASTCTTRIPTVEEFVNRLLEDIKAQPELASYDAHEVAELTLRRHYGCAASQR